MPTQVATDCCIVGGGPAGLMLGLLLARQGVRTLVLEKHADFLRDFRGDTIHPSTLEVMHELGLLDEFLRLPHQKVHRLNVQFGDLAFPMADFSRLPSRCKFVAMMPQWDFLKFLADKAAQYPTFELKMRAEATGIVTEGDRITGVTAETVDGPLTVRADLVVGADGRHSVVRTASSLKVDQAGAPIDVFWFRIPRLGTDTAETVGRFDLGSILVMINRGDYWQCAFVIPKGSADRVRDNGLAAFRDTITRLAPFIGERTRELSSWDDIKLLTVRIDRLRQWFRPGLLCIGDAAHAMSPVGGVGINLAIQDAVAGANILGEPLRERRLTTRHLKQVQDRRALPTRAVQGAQVFLQNRVIAPVIGGSGSLEVPFPVRMLQRFPILRRIPARVMGLGIRQEHVRTGTTPSRSPVPAPA